MNDFYGILASIQCIDVSFTLVVSMAIKKKPSNNLSIIGGSSHARFKRWSSWKMMIRLLPWKIRFTCVKNWESPFVFDLHHHEANHGERSWEENWKRICATWKDSPLPIKIHISSPRSESNFRAHANYIEPEAFVIFWKKVKGSVRQIDVMIEAKQKDEALFQLVRDLKEHSDYEWVDQASFYI